MSEKNGMNYLTPKKPVSEIQRDTRRSSSAQEVAALVFVKMAQEEQFDEVTIAEHPDLFVQWDENWRGKRGDIVQDEGNLYRSIHDVNDAGQNTKPSETPSMWTPLGKPGEEFPEWSQPLGAHDAYAQGAKVSHNGKKWVSTIANNVWEPGVYGWDEYVAPVKAQEAPQDAAEGPEEAPGVYNYPMRAKREGRGGKSRSSRGSKSPPSCMGRSPRLGAVDASERASDLLLRTGLFLSNILSAFRKKVVALQLIRESLI